MLRRQGFTLIEVLVTISIIALMIGILLPALSQARKKAEDTECKARLGQIMLAQEMHATEHGVFTKIWNVDDGSYSEEGPEPPKTNLEPYLDMSPKQLEDPDSVLQCPSVSDEEIIEAFDNRLYGQRPSSIGFNSAMYFDQWDFIPDRIPSASEIIVIAEQAVEPFEEVLTVEGIVARWGAGDPFWDQVWGHKPERGYRHGVDGSNVAMADGHVERLQHESLYHESGHWFWWTLKPNSIRPPLTGVSGCNCN